MGKKSARARQVGGLTAPSAESGTPSFGDGSLRKTSAKGPVEVVAARLAVVRDAWLNLEDDSLIVVRLSREWGLTKRALQKYLKQVKDRLTRENRTRTAAQDAEHERMVATVRANLVRQKATEQAASMGETRDFKAEVASQRAQIVAVERLCAMQGLDAPKQVEKTVTHAAEAPAQRAEREAAALGMTVEEYRARKAKAALGPTTTTTLPPGSTVQ